MTSALAKHAHYFADFQSLVHGPGACSPSWLQSLREDAWVKFNATGFPTSRRGNERWKYTNVGPIAKVNFGVISQPPAVDGLKALVPDYKIDGSTVYDLVFVDGHYSP